MPTEVTYLIDKVEWVRTKQGGKTMVVSLADKDGEKLKAFAASCLIRDLDGLSDDDECYIKSLENQITLSPGQIYYHYELMKSKC